MTDIGVECGKGWEKLYEVLFQLCKMLNIEVLQVKEKFGGLRFYVGDVPAEYAGMVQTFIHAIESESYRVCEICGITNRHHREGDTTYTPVIVTTEGIWRKTLCQRCRGARSAAKGVV